MKKLILMIVAGLLATVSQATAQNRRQEQDPNRKTAYIDQRLAKLLVESVSTMNQKQLQGAWKLVLVGPTETSIGRYDSNGIAYSEGKFLTFAITSTTTSWLPQSVNRQIVVVPSLDIKVYFDAVAKANEPSAAVLEGDFLFLKSKDKSLKCGFVNSHSDRLICVPSYIASYEPSVIGFERINSPEKQ